jgi:O-antigen ligase
MSPDSRPLRLATLVSRLCLLAAFFGGQLVFWQDSSDPFAPVQIFWLKTFLPLGVLPLLAARREALAGLLKAWPARLLLAWCAWLWVSALISPPAFRGDALKTALEYNLMATAFFAGAVCEAKQRRALLAAFFCGGLLSAVYSFGQHFGADPWRWSTDFGGRPLGTIGNPNFLGGHLLLAWGLALSGLLAANPERRRPWAVILALVSAVLYFTKTVGVWLGMAAALLLLGAFVLAPAGEAWRRRWQTDSRRILKVAAMAAGLGTLLLGGLWALGPLKSFSLAKGNSATNRMMMWKCAVQLWKQAPVQGTGLATYRPEFPRLQAAVLEQEKGKGWNYVVTWLPHQNYLYLLAETGLIGLALFLALWAAALRRGWNRAALGDREALGALLALCALAGAGFLNTFSNIAPTALGSFLLLGVLARERNSTPSQAVPLEVWISAVIVALLLAQPAGKELFGNRLTRQAGRAVKLGDHALAAHYYGRASGLGLHNFTQQSLVGVDFQWGESLRQSGRLQEAVEAYRKDLIPNPWAPEGRNMLGASLGQLGAASRRGDLVAEGAEHLRQAAWLNPGYTAALVNLGGSYMTLGNISGAAKAWQEILVYDPSNAEALGYLQMLKGKR